MKWLVVGETQINPKCVCWIRRAPRGSMLTTTDGTHHVFLNVSYEDLQRKIAEAEKE